MSKYLWLLDNGHGGIINGIYQTKGKRSPLWNDGRQLFEGELNRAVVARLAELCAAEGIRYAMIVPECADVPLRERVNRANAWHAIERRCILISAHSNAGGGRGFEIYTSPGETKSDRVADIVMHHFSEEFPTERMRVDVSDGDVDKESAFTILTDTSMPAVLPESFFYDNERECKKYLIDPAGRDRIAKAYFKAILDIENREL